MNIISPGNFLVKSVFPTSIINDDINAINTAGYFIIPGLYERPMIDWASQFIRPGSSFVDVGAHIGSWSLLMANRAKQVYAFEPQRMRYYQLCGNIAINNLTNIFANNTGLASAEKRNTRMTLTKFRVDSGSSTLRDDAAAHWISTGHAVSGTEDIHLQCLDDFELQDVSLMKIDVEGFELEVLKGAEQALAKHRPHIVLELWDGDWFKTQREETITWLWQHDYEVTGVRGYADYYICQHKACA